MTQTKKNFIYNAAYQVFSIIIPVILAPFISRRLGVNGSGVYSYTYSIVYYFSLFAMLGMNNYGSRKIAKVRDSKEKLSSTFWELYAIQITLGIIMFVLFILGLLFVFNNYKDIFIIQSLFLFSSMLDINWFFYGVEEFKLTVLRSFIIRIISFGLILFFIKNGEDVWKYALIMGLSAFVNQLVLWPFLKKRVTFHKPNFSSFKKHIKPLLILFIPVIAVSVYKIMDKIMLGFIANVNEVGFYEYAEKINSIPLTVIAALGTVMMPKISNLVAKDNREEVLTYLDSSIKFVLTISVPIIFAFCFSMKTIVPWYLGNDFEPTANLVILLSITLPFVSFANVIRTQYLIPMEKDKIYVTSVIIGAVLNLLFNFIFIPIYGALGACIGTIVAEISVMIYQTICVRKDIRLRYYLQNWVVIVLKSLISAVPVLVLNYIPLNNLVRVILQVVLYGIIYILLNFKYIMSKLGLIKKSV